MNTTATRLHTYRCPNCKAVAISTLDTTDLNRPLRCPADRSPLRYEFTTPIETDEDRAIAAQVTVYRSLGSVDGPSTKRSCAYCRRYVERAEMIDLGAAGRFCSSPCADAGSERHQRAMEGLQARLETLYTERPYLRPKVGA